MFSLFVDVIVMFGRLLCGCIMFCAVRSLGTRSSVNFVQVQSVVIFDNEAATWSCVLHMNGSVCFLKSFSLRTVKLSSQWLEIVVCYIWLGIGCCF